MLRQTVERDFDSVDHGLELETLEALIDERQRELSVAALALGARFYAEKTSAFCSRLARYWRAWRGERKPGTRLA